MVALNPILSFGCFHGSLFPIPTPSHYFDFNSRPAMVPACHSPTLWGFPFVEQRSCAFGNVAAYHEVDYAFAPWTAVNVTLVFCKWVTCKETLVLGKSMAATLAQQSNWFYCFHFKQRHARNPFFFLCPMMRLTVSCDSVE